MVKLDLEPEEEGSIPESDSLSSSENETDAFPEDEEDTDDFENNPDERKPGIKRPMLNKT